MCARTGLIIAYSELREHLEAAGFQWPLWVQRISKSQTPSLSNCLHWIPKRLVQLHSTYLNLSSSAPHCLSFQADLNLYRNVFVCCICLFIGCTWDWDSISHPCMPGIVMSSSSIVIASPISSSWYSWSSP